MNEWEDICFKGKSSKFAIIFQMSIIILSMYIFLLRVLFYEIEIDDKWFSIIALVLLGFGFVWSIKSHIEENRTIKLAILGIGKIVGHCYFGNKFIMDFEEIESIENTKTDIFMKNMRLFNGNKKGFDIHLTNGKLYRVSPHLTNFEDFRKILENSINKN